MKQYRNLLILLIPFVLLKVFFLYLPFWADEIIYADVNLVQLGFGQFIPTHPDYFSYSGHPPLLQILLWLLFRLFDHHFFWSHTLFLLFSLNLVFVQFRLMEKFYSKREALLSSAFLLVMPLFFTQSSMVLGNLPMISMGLTAFYFQVEKKWGWAFVFFLIAAMIRETALTFSLISFSYWFLAQKDEKKFAFLSLAPVGFLLLYYLGEYLSTGHIFNNPSALNSLQHTRAGIDLLFPFRSLSQTLGSAVCLIGIATLIWNIKTKRQKRDPFLISLGIGSFVFLFFFVLYGDSQARDIFLFYLFLMMLFSRQLVLIERDNLRIGLTFLSFLFLISKYRHNEDFSTPWYIQKIEVSQKLGTWLDENKVNTLSSRDKYLEAILSDPFYGYVKSKIAFNKEAPIQVLDNFTYFSKGILKKQNQKHFHRIIDRSGNWEVRLFKK